MLMGVLATNSLLNYIREQAGAELCQAQEKLGLVN